MANLCPHHFYFPDNSPRKLVPIYMKLGRPQSRIGWKTVNPLSHRGLNPGHCLTGKYVNTITSLLLLYCRLLKMVTMKSTLLTNTFNVVDILPCTSFLFFFKITNKHTTVMWIYDCHDLLITCSSHSWKLFTLNILISKCIYILLDDSVSFFWDL